MNLSKRNKIAGLLLLAGLFTLPAASGAAPKPNWSLLEKVPILHEGRIKPLHTFAEVQLLTYQERRTIKDMSVMEWLMEALLDSANARERRIFKIGNPDVLKALNMEATPSKLYSYEETSRAINGILSTIQEIYSTKRERRTPAQQQLLMLYFKIIQFGELTSSLDSVLPAFLIKSKRLADSLQLPMGEFVSGLDVQRKSEAIRKLWAKIKDKEQSKFSPEETELAALHQTLGVIEQNANSSLFRVIPPQWSGEERWFSPWGIVMAGKGSPASARFVQLWGDLAPIFKAKDAEKWKSAAEEIVKFSEEQSRNYVSPGKLSFEVLYNRLDLFTWSLTCYVAAFLLLAFSWIFWPQRLQAGSFALLALGALLQLVGMTMRVFIMARAPVATLYESVIFVGMVAVIIALVLEWIRRNGVGLLIGAVSGAALHFVGIGYAMEGDSMGMLNAVLNTNFWLAVHVVTIAIGYGACFVGGILGHVYLVRRIVRPNEEAQLSDLYRSMIGVSLVALFFTIFGTVTGGIWADQSWGRFWGWDPKENGALLICLWLLWVMHGRIAGYIKAPGYAVGMIITNITVALAWFGVNLLNVGLHSYGFAGNVATNLAAFTLFELLFSLVGYMLATDRIHLKIGNLTIGKEAETGKSA